MKKKLKKSVKDQTGKLPKYRSPMERRVHEVLPTFEYENLKLDYTTHRKYIPDLTDKKRKILIEVKGFFRQGDDKKYASIKECHPDWRMIFVFSDPHKKARKGGVARKDGTYLTLADWATQNGWEWCTEDNLPKDLK